VRDAGKGIFDNKMNRREGRASFCIAADEQWGYSNSGRGLTLCLLSLSFSNPNPLLWGRDSWPFRTKICVEWM